MKPIVFVLNGPPGCGKDTIARGYLNLRETGLTKYESAFKEPMYRIAAETLGMTYHGFLDKYADRDWKERKRPEWGDQSVRDLMIRISETYVKPFFGDEHFGKVAVSNLLRNAGDTYREVTIFTDGGFEAEIKELEKVANVVVVHVHRTGTDFTGDSRSYIGCSGRIAVINNNGTIEAAVNQLKEIVDESRATFLSFN